MTRRGKDKIGFSRQALLHPIPPRIAGRAPEGQKEAPARTPKGPNRPDPRSPHLPGSCRSCLRRSGAEEAQGPTQKRSEKTPPVPQSLGAEPGSADSAFPIRGLYGNASLALLGLRRTLLFGSTLQTLRSWTVPVPAY